MAKMTVALEFTLTWMPDAAGGTAAWRGSRLCPAPLSHRGFAPPIGKTVLLALLAMDAGGLSSVAATEVLWLAAVPRWPRAGRVVSGHHMFSVILTLDVQCGSCDAVEGDTGLQM
jgi:hypothetical protein